MSKNPINQKRGRRERKGVGAIMGGVILMAILLTTVLVYFITIQNNEKTKTSYEIKAAQATQDKQAEKYAVLRDTGLSGNNLSVSIDNEGSLPMVVSKVLLYCVSAGCTSPEPVEIPPSLTLNAGESTTRLAGPVSDALTYRVDVISERGNIVSALECTVDAAANVCKNDSNGSSSPDFSLAALPSTLVIETGKSGTSTIEVTSLNGFNSAVTLSISSTIAGVTPTFTPTSSVTPPSGGSDSRTLTIPIPSSAAPGNYAMTITGTSPGMPTHTIPFIVSILPSQQAAVDTGIIQGTGSLKLDFKAFGAIYPDWQLRGGVDQTGWRVNVASPYSSVPGYPAWDAMWGRGNFHITYVESARNMDPSGQDLVLSRTTGLMTNTGQVNGQIPQPNYICKGDATTRTLSKYNEGANKLVLPNTPAGSPQTTNWRSIFFCSDTVSDGGAGAPSLWTPCKNNCNTFGNLNALFMIARGTFTPIFSEYSQTIPYQGVGYATTSLLTCIRNADVTTACAAPNVADGAASLKYFDNKNNMKSGVTVYLHVTGGTTPYSITWLYPDGTDIQLTPTVTANGNYKITIPTGNSNNNDGNTNDIDTYCNGVPSMQSVYFTLSVTDSFSTSGDRNAYHMTWGMVC
ncbi:MAG: hypothetical protein ABI348_04955 [Nitrososphaera sp.]